MWPQPLLRETASARWLLIQLVATETQQHLKGDELKGKILEGSRKRGCSGCSEDEDARSRAARGLVVHVRGARLTVVHLLHPSHPHHIVSCVFIDCCLSVRELCEEKTL